MIYYADNSTNEPFCGITDSRTASNFGNDVKAQAHLPQPSYPYLVALLVRASLPPAASDTRHSVSRFQVAAELSDVTLRRGAEKFFLLPAKVRRVLIAHAVPRARRVQVFAE